MKKIHHLSHIDLDGYSCQLVMKYTPYELEFYNANYGAEVKDQLELMLEDINKQQKQEVMILISDLNLLVDEAKWIDKEINKHLKEWKIDELGNIERAILRLGAYEIMFVDLDPAVVINEAVEISKSFAAEQSPKFINGVLDAIAKDTKK